MCMQGIPAIARKIGETRDTQVARSRPSAFSSPQAQIEQLNHCTGYSGRNVQCTPKSNGNRRRARNVHCIAVACRRVWPLVGTYSVISTTCTLCRLRMPRQRGWRLSAISISPRSARSAQHGSYAHMSCRGALEPIQGKPINAIWRFAAWMLPRTGGGSFRVQSPSSRSMRALRLGPLRSAYGKPLRRGPLESNFPPLAERPQGKRGSTRYASPRGRRVRRVLPIALRPCTSHD